jgi:hypothetical protein
MNPSREPIASSLLVQTFSADRNPSRAGKYEEFRNLPLGSRVGWWTIMPGVPRYGPLREMRDIRNVLA